jgi:hypothetical protein
MYVCGVVKTVGKHVGRMLSHESLPMPLHYRLQPLPGRAPLSNPTATCLRSEDGDE